jgi:hypothetical protein
MKQSEHLLNKYWFSLLMASLLWPLCGKALTQSRLGDQNRQLVMFTNGAVVAPTQGTCQC